MAEPITQNDFLTREECIRIVDKALRAANAPATVLQTTPFKIATLFDMIEEDIEERGGRPQFHENTASIAFDTGNGRENITYALQNADKRPPMIHREHLSIFAPSLETVPKTVTMRSTRPSIRSTATLLEDEWVSGRKLLALLKAHVPNTSAKSSRHELLLRMVVRKMYDKLEEPEGVIAFKDQAGQEQTIRCHQVINHAGKLSVAVHKDDLETMYAYAEQAYNQRNQLYSDSSPATRQR